MQTLINTPKKSRITRSQKPTARSPFYLLYVSIISYEYAHFLPSSIIFNPTIHSIYIHLSHKKLLARTRGLCCTRARASMKIYAWTRALFFLFFFRGDSYVHTCIYILYAYKDDSRRVKMLAGALRVYA